MGAMALHGMHLSAPTSTRRGSWRAAVGPGDATVARAAPSPVRLAASTTPRATRTATTPPTFAIRVTNAPPGGLVIADLRFLYNDPNCAPEPQRGAPRFRSEHGRGCGRK